MSIHCPNKNCRSNNGERTMLPSDANYCFVCGWAVSDKAKEKKEKEINSIRFRKLNDANNKISVLELKINENEKALTEFDGIKRENETLKKRLSGIEERAKQQEDTIINDRNVKYKNLPILLMIFLLAAIFFLVMVLFRI